MGASAVQIGTGFLRCPEAGISPAWQDALATAMPEQTLVTRAFSGRPGRSVKTKYLEAIHGLHAPDPAPYPIQRALTGPMRGQGAKDDDLDRLQAWAGQSARLAQAKPAKTLTKDLWQEAENMLTL